MCWLVHALGRERLERRLLPVATAAAAACVCACVRVWVVLNVHICLHALDGKVLYSLLHLSAMPSLLFKNF